MTPSTAVSSAHLVKTISVVKNPVNFGCVANTLLFAKRIIAVALHKHSLSSMRDANAANS